MPHLVKEDQGGSGNKVPGCKKEQGHWLSMTTQPYVINYSSNQQSRLGGGGGNMGSTVYAGPTSPPLEEPSDDWKLQKGLTSWCQLE